MDCKIDESLWAFDKSGITEGCSPKAKNIICYKVSARKLFLSYSKFCRAYRYQCMKAEAFHEIYSRLFSFRSRGAFGEYVGIRICKDIL